MASENLALPSQEYNNIKNLTNPKYFNSSRPILFVIIIGLILNWVYLTQIPDRENKLKL